MSVSENSNAIKFSIHLLLWLIKDTVWLWSFDHLALFMIVPTIGYTCYLLYLNIKDKKIFILYLANLFWLLGNSSWIVNDFVFENKYNIVSYLFFIIGIIIAFFHIIKLKNVGQ